MLVTKIIFVLADSVVSIYEAVIFPLPFTGSGVFLLLPILGR